MARKEIDPIRAKSALAVAKQHPGMILFLASPAIVAVVLVGVFVGTGWAILLALALLVAGGVVLRRNL
ncbi:MULTISPECIES: hypothetical protein [Mycobacteriaceae]|uniref:Uncharacterized protein n=1 Tax=Mycolicibacterium mucogenicum DSM 44124 TaxID=1226753 RepID=A0A8H2JA99_MYCMU|nr:MULTISPECIES: hypothetical protein [Mycobacteriaceae]KAB7757130.1 membrane protein [Mycolicibacterium mucogenicum DSM 44124]QPG70615.1 hypothetical protein C1S78_006485 [Mycolicibacterium mucogenicum DSM 44124]SEB26775.1 hypothetical protein SAMN04488580_1234 [Mycobacterium sp. 283mftsu]